MKTRIGMIAIAVTMLAILAPIAGCTSMDDGRYRHEQGWRVGNILQIGPGTTAFPPAAFDCRRAASSAGSIEHDFAYVHLVNAHEDGKYFNSNSKVRNAIVRIPPGASFKEGEGVYVNIRDCTQLLAHR